MRTFSRGDWMAAQAAWTDGEFSAEWSEVRHVMAMQGCIFPPAGTRWDSWEDDQPSQRAVLIRAIRETPALLARCMRGATTWSKVIDRLLRERDDWRAEMARSARGMDPDDLAARRGAAQSVAAILARLADSVGVER